MEAHMTKRRKRLKNIDRKIENAILPENPTAYSLRESHGETHGLGLIPRGSRVQLLV
jgi:hypothetical protein